MATTLPDTQNGSWAGRIPVAAIVWLVATVLVVLIGTQTISLRDEERFVNDVRLASQEGEAANTIILEVTDGTFEYNVTPRQPADVETGTYTRESRAAVAADIFDNIDEVTEVTVAPQTITVTYEGDMEGERMLRRVRRIVRNTLLNDPAAIQGAVSEEEPNTLVFTTTDETFRYGRFIPALIEQGTTEHYATREEGLDGSPLAQTIFEAVTAVEALTITPDRLTVTYREGAIPLQITSRVQDALNDFYPRASMNPNLWLMTIVPDADRVIRVKPVDSGIQLYWFALAFAVLEAGLFFYLFSHENKLLLALVRVVGIFLFFWSLFGHEPLWDYLMGKIFPTSRQVVYPTANVIEFVAQHLELVFVSSLVTIPGGLLIGIAVTRANLREILPLVNNLVNSGQTVPTIAIVAFMAPIIGFGFWPAIIALIAYGLLPVVRNTIAGLESVDAFVIDSSRGMGMTPTQILLQTELPIASSIIMAGVRTSMVVNVGTATLGAFVGSGGLGTPIASGLGMTIDAFVLLGALPAAVLAILVDYILSRVEFVLTPKGLQVEN